MNSWWTNCFHRYWSISWSTVSNTALSEQTYIPRLTMPALQKLLVLSLKTKSAEQNVFFTRFNRCYYKTGNVSSIFHALLQTKDIQTNQHKRNVFLSQKERISDEATK